MDPPVHAAPKNRCFAAAVDVGGADEGKAQVWGCTDKCAHPSIVVLV